MNNLATFIATGAYVGNIPKAPGTFGSVFGLALFAVLWDAIVIHFGLLTTIGIVALSTLAIYVAGAWATRVYMAATDQHDPKEVVIDEIVGIFVMMLVVLPFFSQFDAVSLGILFVLFRLFDITKPWLVGTIDRTMDSAHGVMLDDVAAGIYAGITFIAGTVIWQFIQ